MDVREAVENLRRSVAMANHPAQRALTAEQAEVLLSAIDELAGKLERIRAGLLTLADETQVARERH